MNDERRRPLRVRRKYAARRNGWMLWAAGGALALIVVARLVIGLD
jgi:hypothetical protein